MNSITQFATHLDHKQLANLAGIKLIKRFCNPDKCTRQGEHNTHSWFEEVLITDEVTTSSKDNPKMDLPIRYWNFCFAYSKILSLSRLPKFEKIQKALEYAKQHCFDLDGSPAHLARAFQFKNYSKFNEMVNSTISKYE